MDGVSGLTQEPVQPGASFVYDFEVPDAGTYWYHAHNKSWNQVGRGLYGPMIIDEPEKPFDRSHDIALVLVDWRLRRPGVLDTESFGSLMDWSHGGRLGNWITVNGEPAPVMALRRGEAYRLRLINAANARVFEVNPNRFDAKGVVTLTCEDQLPGFSDWFKRCRTPSSKRQWLPSGGSGWSGHFGGGRERRSSCGLRSERR